MQVKIVRHHRRTKNAHGDVKHSLIDDDLPAWHETGQNLRQLRLGKNQLGGETTANSRDKSNDQGLDVTETFVLQIEHRQHIRCGDQTAPKQRNAEEKLQPDSRADHLGEIAGRDSDFAQNPESPHYRCRVVIPTRLGQIAPSGDAQLDAQVLEENCHQVRNHDDRQKGVAKPRASSQIRSPVARVHVTDRDEKTGPRKREKLSPKRRGHRNHNAAVNFG